jgi:hypothetical protein
MEPVQAGDFVKHKTISWMNGGKPFRVIKVENGKAFCEYTGKNSIQYFHEFDAEQLVVIERPPVSGNNRDIPAASEE